MIKIELQSPLGDGFLDAFTVRCIAGRTGTPLSLVDEATDLIGGPTRVLLAGAEAVHRASMQMTIWIMLIRCIRQVACDCLMLTAAHCRLPPTTRVTSPQRALR